MKLFFIDETGNFNQKQVVLRGGVIFDIENYFKLLEHSKSIKFEYFGNNKLEIKWSDISIAVYLINTGKQFNKKLKWLENYKVDYLLQYLEKTIRNVCNKSDCIITSISNSVNFQSESDMILYHLSDLMERYQFYLQEVDDYGVIVFDSINLLKDRYLKNCYQFLLDNHNYIEKYDRIVDSLLCEISIHSTGVQSADYSIGVIGGVLRGYSFSDKMFQLYIKNKIRSKNGKLLGYGVKVSPSQDKKLKEHVKGRLKIV